MLQDVSTDTAGGWKMALVYRDNEPGKICTKCKLWRPVAGFRLRAQMRDGYDSICRECLNAGSRRWRDQNKERVAQLNREYYEANREERKAYHRRYHHEHKEYFRRKIIEFRQKNASYHRDYVRNWSRRNPDKIMVQGNARRAAKQRGGKFTAVEWADLKQCYDYHCLRCGRREPEIKLSVDHVIPLSQGGANTIDNIQPLCRACNSAKHIATTDYRPLWDVLHPEG
ncbi:MAG: HNH endonuclease [Oscillochloridaceae bacterium umkhey_bin13]